MPGGSPSQLSLVVQHTVVELIADVKSGLLSKCIQVRADRLNVSVPLGLNKHTDDADTRDIEVVGPCPSMLLIHVTS